MKRSLLFALGLGLVSVRAGAQQSGIANLPVSLPDMSKVGPNEYGNLNDLTNGAPQLMTRRTNTTGSPYAEDRWLMANVLLTNKMYLVPLLLKYDVLDHNLVMRKPAPSQDSMALDDRQVVSFVLQEPATGSNPAHQRLFRRFAEGPAGRQLDYVEVLHEGQYSLLKHHQKEIKRAGFQGMYSNGIPTDEIEDNSVYYLRMPDHTLTPVKLNLKALQTAAPALSAALKTAASAQKPRTEADWAAVLNAADAAK